MKKYLFYILFICGSFSCSEDKPAYLDQGNNLNASFEKAVIDAGVKVSSGGKFEVAVLRGNLLNQAVDVGVSLKLSNNVPAAANVKLASSTIHFAAGEGIGKAVINYDFEGLEFYEIYPLVLSFTNPSDGPLFSANAECTVKLARLCEYDPSLTVGEYKVDAPSWEYMDGHVTFRADTENPYRIYIDNYPEDEGFVSNGNRIQLDIDPETYAVTGPKVIISPNAGSYTNLAFEVKGGTYSPCTGTFVVTFAITVAQGSFGSFEFTFTRR